MKPIVIMLEKCYKFLWNKENIWDTFEHKMCLVVTPSGSHLRYFYNFSLERQRSKYLGSSFVYFFQSCISLTDDGTTLFRKTEGLSNVCKICFSKDAKPSLVQQSFLTLGNAVISSGKLTKLIKIFPLYLFIITIYFP